MSGRAGWALVTGASGGLGLEFARQLAARGLHVILVARSYDKLAAVASEISLTYGVEARILVEDLARPNAAAAVDRWLDDQGIVVDVLVVNAGFGLHGPFVDQKLDQLHEMLQLDVIALTEMTHFQARRMRHRGSGRILLVGSMASYQPVAYYSAYAAAKAYVLSFGAALQAELAPAVQVTVLSPGLMDTGFNTVAGYVTPAGLKRMELAPAKVARIGLAALFAGRPEVIAGRLNTVMAMISGVVSRRFAARASLNMAKRQESGHG